MVGDKRKDLDATKKEIMMIMNFLMRMPVMVMDHYLTIHLVLETSIMHLKMKNKTLTKVNSLSMQ